MKQKFLNFLKYKECPKGISLLKRHNWNYTYEEKIYDQMFFPYIEFYEMDPYYKINEKYECKNCGKIKENLK